jgi:hypothetical protein
LDLCRVTTKARWSKDQRAFSFVRGRSGVPRLSGSHTSRSDPSGLAGRKPSGIPSAAIMRSQDFSQFQLSFPSESRWVPAPAVSGCAEPWYTGAGESGRPAVFPQRAFGFTRQRWERVVLVPLEAALERNFAYLGSKRFEAGVDRGSASPYLLRCSR